MEQAVHVFSIGRRNSEQQEKIQERKELTASLSRTQVQIQQAYSAFNNVKDHDLIESYVYEINALEARYNYLLRKIKNLEEGP